MRAKISAKPDKICNVILAIIVVIITLFTLYPFLYCLAYSLSDPVQLSMKGVFLLPAGFTLENYKTVFRNPVILPAFGISIARTVIGVVYTCLVTGMASYAVSKKDLPGRKWISYFLIIPMYVGGGMIASYVNIYQLGLHNNFLVYILPAGFATYYMLLMRTFFSELPVSLEEAARLDGAGEAAVFFRIIFPLSKPIFATIALFAGVSQWNSWYDAMVYVTNTKLYPIQMILQQILMGTSASTMMKQAQAASQGARTVTPETIQTATLIVTVVPITLIYPFLQKYFVKGIMIGAVKS